MICTIKKQERERIAKWFDDYPGELSVLEFYDKENKKIDFMHIAEAIRSGKI